MEFSWICELELSIVVPCFDEVLRLHELVRRCGGSTATAVGNNWRACRSLLSSISTNSQSLSSSCRSDRIALTSASDLQPIASV